MKIIIACGASGGHIFPGIALAEELRGAGNNDILIICSDKEVDVEILKNSGYDFKTMPRNPFTLSPNPVKLLKFFSRLAAGTFGSIKMLLGYGPDCVVGFGGFASAPVIFAAWVLRIPRIIHEQNIVAGMANRLEAIFVDRIAVSFEVTRKYFNRSKVAMVGNPVRKSFRNLEKAPSREGFGLERDRFTLFIMGGSQGASALNRAVADMLSDIDHSRKKNLQVIHVTGKNDYESIRQRYLKENIKSKVYPFLNEIDRAYTASDLVISRSGATTIAELTYFGKPSILIPYGKKSVHQAENAYYLSGEGAALTVEEDKLDAGNMKKLVTNFMEDPGRLNEFSANSKRLGRPDAAKALAEEIVKLIRRGNVKE